MDNKEKEIYDLLNLKDELKVRLNLITYDGTVEIKTINDKKYLYIRKRELGKVTSTYVGPFSEELYRLLIKDTTEAKKLKKQIRSIEKKLFSLGHIESKTPKEIITNIEFAKANIKTIIYDQAILEGISTTFPETENIIESGIIKNVSVKDVTKIINLKRAWEFVLDENVIQSKSNYYLAKAIAKIINEGFYQDGGRTRFVTVIIGGTSYIPPIPIEDKVKEDLSNIIAGNDILDNAIELALYIMRTQTFIDGNKRTAIIFANHYLIQNAKGLLVVPHNLVGDFKKLLVNFYETNDSIKIKRFLKEHCYMSV